MVRGWSGGSGGGKKPKGKLTSACSSVVNVALPLLARYQYTRAVFNGEGDEHIWKVSGETLRKESGDEHVAELQFPVSSSPG